MRGWCVAAALKSLNDIICLIQVFPCACFAFCLDQMSEVWWKWWWWGHVASTHEIQLYSLQVKEKENNICAKWGWWASGSCAVKGNSKQRQEYKCNRIQCKGCVIKPHCYWANATRDMWELHSGCCIYKCRMLRQFRVMTRSVCDWIVSSNIFQRLIQWPSNGLCLCVTISFIFILFRVILSLPFSTFFLPLVTWMTLCITQLCLNSLAHILLPQLRICFQDQPSTSKTFTSDYANYFIVGFKD